MVLPPMYFPIYNLHFRLPEPGLHAHPLLGSPPVPHLEGLHTVQWLKQDKDHLTKTVKGDHLKIALRNHDTGKLIPHIPIPLMAGPKLLETLKKSQYVAIFHQSNVKVDKDGHAIAIFFWGLAPTWRCFEIPLPIPPFLAKLAGLAKTSKALKWLAKAEAAKKAVEEAKPQSFVEYWAEKMGEINGQIDELSDIYADAKESYESAKDDIAADVEMFKEWRTGEPGEFKEGEGEGGEKSAAEKKAEADKEKEEKAREKRWEEREKKAKEKEGKEKEGEKKEKEKEKAGGGGAEGEKKDDRKPSYGEAKKSESKAQDDQKKAEAEAKRADKEAEDLRKEAAKHDKAQEKAAKESQEHGSKAETAKQEEAAHRKDASEADDAAKRVQYARRADGKRDDAQKSFESKEKLDNKAEEHRLRSEDLKKQADEKAKEAAEKRQKADEAGKQAEKSRKDAEDARQREIHGEKDSSSKEGAKTDSKDAAKSDSAKPSEAEKPGQTAPSSSKPTGSTADDGPSYKESRKSESDALNERRQADTTNRKASQEAKEHQDAADEHGKARQDAIKERDAAGKESQKLNDEAKAHREEAKKAKTKEESAEHERQAEAKEREAKKAAKRQAEQHAKAEEEGRKQKARQEAADKKKQEAKEARDKSDKAQKRADDSRKQAEKAKKQELKKKREAKDAKIKAKEAHKKAYPNTSASVNFPSLLGHLPFPCTVQVYMSWMDLLKNWAKGLGAMVCDILKAYLGWFADTVGLSMLGDTIKAVADGLLDGAKKFLLEDKLEFKFEKKFGPVKVTAEVKQDDKGEWKWKASAKSDNKKAKRELGVSAEGGLSKPSLDKGGGTVKQGDYSGSVDASTEGDTWKASASVKAESKGSGGKSAGEAKVSGEGSISEGTVDKASVSGSESYADPTGRTSKASASKEWDNKEGTEKLSVSGESKNLGESQSASYERTETERPDGSTTSTSKLTTEKKTPFNTEKKEYPSDSGASDASPATETSSAPPVSYTDGLPML